MAASYGKMFEIEKTVYYKKAIMLAIIAMLVFINIMIVLGKFGIV